MRRGDADSWARTITITACISSWATARCEQSDPWFCDEDTPCELPEFPFCECQIDEDCTQNYDGPSGGEPTCGVMDQDGNTYCAIACTSNGDCPSSMECNLSAGGVCYPP